MLAETNVITRYEKRNRIILMCRLYRIESDVYSLSMVCGIMAAVKKTLWEYLDTEYALTW